MLTGSNKIAYLASMGAPAWLGQIRRSVTNGTARSPCYRLTEHSVYDSAGAVARVGGLPASLIGPTRGLQIAHGASPVVITRLWSEPDAGARSRRAAGLFRVAVHSGRHWLTAPTGGQCVRYLLCGLFPAAQGRPPLSCGGP